MKALVTGSAGFVGRHMLAELQRRGWAVHSVDLNPMDVVVDLRQSAHVHVISDALELFRLGLHSFDLVVHAAASEPHRAAIDGDQMHMVRNLHLDSAMFEWAVRTGTRVLYLSSSAAYPVRFQTGADIWEGVRLAEDDIVLDDPEQPDAAYGWAKLTGEKMAAAAAEHIPVHVVRPFSGYGEDQDERFPFGAFVARAKRREDPFVIWGDGTQTRDWIHISDVVAGALAVVDQDVREPVNLCTGVGASMLDLVALVCDGYTPEVELQPDKPTGVAYRVGDPTRLHRIYQPRVSLAEGVARAL